MDIFFNSFFRNRVKIQNEQTDMKTQTDPLSKPKGVEAMVEALLKKTMTRVKDLLGLTVVTREGLPIASLSVAEIDEALVSAMSSAILVLAKRVTNELNRGDMNKTIIQGSDGLVVLMEAGADALLLGVTNANAKMGVVLFDMERAASAIAELVSPP
jgi:predicted regulator of Ras-like GTPase activity (Roadblock/LC7/MglB family)